MLKIGKLNKKIDILKPELTEDTGFGQITNYKPFVYSWAEFLKQRITPMNANGDASAVMVTQGMKIRPIKEIEKGWRVKYGSRTFEILSVDNNQADVMILTTQELLT